MNEYPDIKIKCDCGKKIVDIFEPTENFVFVGTDDRNNPIFECKDCGVQVWG